MDSKWIAIIILAFLIPATFIGFSLILTMNSPISGSAIETCETIVNNGKDKIDIVFFSEKEGAKKYSDFLLNTTPFDKNKEEFNFYYIDSYKPECDLYKGIAILCHSKELIKKASACPNDHIIVLEDRKKSIRSSAYMNVISINTASPLTVMTHEFGHSFVNLAEEYTPAKIPRGSENCVNSCDDFNKDIDGCFQECSDSSHVRSIENGVMRTLNSNTYGIYNEKIILTKINKNSNSIITGSVISETTECINQEYYLIEGNYNAGKIDVIETTLETGCFGENGEGIFTYNLEKEDGTQILGENFNPELIFTDGQGEEIIDGETFDFEGNFFLKIPKLSNVESLSILEGNKEVANIQLKNIGTRACKI